MQSSRKDLLTTLENIQGVPIVVVGDVVLDRYIFAEVSRISAEAPVPVALVERTEDRLGGAMNPVHNLVELGARVKACGIIGQDAEGQSVIQLLKNIGVSPEGLIVDKTRPTTVKTRILSQRQQMLRIDREVTANLGSAESKRFAALVQETLPGAKAVILSDYAKGTVGEPLMQMFEALIKSGKLGWKICPLVVDPHPHNYEIYHSLTVAKPNRKEAEAAAGMKISDRDSALMAADRIAKKWHAELLLITLGKDGLLIYTPSDKKATFIDTVAREVFDVTGAGDTVAAVFTAALAVGADPHVAGDLANIAAGVVVSEVGTVPIRRARLISEIERLSSDN